MDYKAHHLAGADDEGGQEHGEGGRRARALIHPMHTYHTMIFAVVTKHIMLQTDLICAILDSRYAIL